MEYAIKISMCPHEWDNKNRPYFWMIEKGGCNYGFGWSETPEMACKDALAYYRKCFEGNEND